MTKAELVKKTLNDQGRKQKWLSEKSAIDYQRLRRILSGIQHFTIEEYETVSKLLDL